MKFLKKNSRRSQVAFSLIVSMTVLAIWQRAAGAEDAKQAMFKRVFGDAAKLDPAMVAKVKALPAGKRLLVDRDGDGKNDEAWFIDTAFRHTFRPILVRVIDEDGDLDQHGPDLDSDLYLVDWHADGKIEVAVDYQDDDADNDADAVSNYSWVPENRYLKRPVLMAWWHTDVGDDNLLWYDVDWTYYQDICQYRCGFCGDRWASGYVLTNDSDRWISLFENPFVFYDPDKDGCSEVVLRFSGLRDVVGSLRYSFDADGDAYGRRAYDYEFSITALAKGARGVRGEATPTSELKLTEEVTSSFRIRGIPTHRVLRWDAAQKFAQQSPWAKACLTWDEMNANTEWNVERDPHERWEGVIVHGSENFPQIGGPPCSKLNKRNEIVTNPASPLRLYYDPTDHRLHLLGTGPAEGWLDVDYDLDGQMDARYTYLDDNRDGVFDRRQIDLDADGKIEFEWKMKGKDVRQLKLEYESLSAFYKQELDSVLDASQRFIDAAKAALGDRLTEPNPVVETFFLTKLQSWYPATRLGQRMRSTPGGARYYVDLLRDRLLNALKQAFGNHRAWERVEAVYAAGNYAVAADLVLKELAPNTQVIPPARFESFAYRIPIHIDNTGGPQRENWPVVLSVESIQAVAKDFNLDNCAVVASHRWIDWLEVQHQVDRIDKSVGKELSFLIDVPANAWATYYLYYSPTGKREKAFARRTGAADWDSNIGWESTFAAYRAYDGQFDFFGKQQYTYSKETNPRRTYAKKVEWLIYPIRGVNYHQETEWGMDALLVGKTSGLGGLTLYAADRAYSVQNPGGEGNIKFTQRVLSSGPIRAAVQIIATNVMPGKPDLAVRMMCIIYAEHQESEIRIVVSSARQAMLLAPGLTRLARETTFLDKSLGCFGTWGYQDEAIGEVGLGLIVPPDRLKDVVEIAEEHRVRCKGPDGKLRYWIIGDWRRGRRFPVAPTADNWRREVQALAGLLHHDVRVAVGAPQKLP